MLELHQLQPRVRLVHRSSRGWAVFGESFGLTWAEQTVMCISYNLTEDFAATFLKAILGMFCPLIFIYLKVLLFLAALGLSCSTWDLSSWREGFFLALVHRLSSPLACGILVPPPGVELKSPLLEGGVLIAGPSGKYPPCLNLKWGQIWSCNFAFQSSFVLIILPFQKRTKWWMAVVTYWSYWSHWGIVGFPDFRNRVSWASLVAQRVKNLSAMRETWAWSLGWEGLLEKGMATYSSILAWRIPWIE